MYSLRAGNNPLIPISLNLCTNNTNTHTHTIHKLHEVRRNQAELEKEGPTQ
jgi:hypothetical protein